MLEKIFGFVLVDCLVDLVIVLVKLMVVLIGGNDFFLLVDNLGGDELILSVESLV